MKPLVANLLAFIVGIGFSVLGILLFRAQAGEPVIIPSPTAGPASPEGAEASKRPAPSPPATKRHIEAPAGGEDSETERSATAPTPSAGPSPVEKAACLTFIRGKLVFGVAGAPLPGVPVRLSKSGWLHSECLTDDEGLFALGVWQEGTWKVTAFPFGNAGLRPMETVEVEGGKDATIDLVVPRLVFCDISGCVTGGQGEGIPGAKVQLRVLHRGVEFMEAEAIETVTGPDGKYELPGIEVELTAPPPVKPRAMTDFETPARKRSYGWQARNVGSSLFFEFIHPEYKKKWERVYLSRFHDGRITLDVRLEPREQAGVVRGTIAGPRGECLDGKTLRAWIEVRGSWSSISTEISGFEFQLDLEHKGTLIIAGPVGRFWVDEMDIGTVGPTTRREGIVVKARSVSTHMIAVLDDQGNPLPVDADTFWAEVETGKGISHGLKVEDERILLPVFFADTVVLKISGQEIVEKELEISAGTLPATIQVEILLPLLSGRIEFPPGFANVGDVQVRIEGMGPGGASRGSRSGSLFVEGLSGFGMGKYDEATGEFELKRTGIEPEGATYTVTITIPGFKPWIKKDIRLKRNETLEGVLVTFK